MSQNDHRRFLASLTTAALSLSWVFLNVPAQSLAAADKENIPEAVDANADYTPLMLPADAKTRGISLSGDTKICRLESGRYKLGCGCVLVHTDEPIHISTCRVQIFARPGATIVVGAKEKATRVLNLSDRKHDSVRVIFGDRHISLNPGEELAVVEASASDADKEANEYVIRYRNAQTIAVSPEYKAVLFEFSLGDAMKHCLIFKQLKSSPKPEDKELLAEIIKTAAAVNTMFSKSRDKYDHLGKESLAAGSNKNNKLAAKKAAKQGLKVAAGAEKRS